MSEPDPTAPASPFAAQLAPERVAFGLLELGSIARGVRVADAAVKQAPALLIGARPVSSGKHLVLLRGQVAEVEESMKAAREVAAEALIDALELPYLAESIWPHLGRALDVMSPLQIAAGAGEGDDDWRDDPDAESVAVVETGTVCATVHAADAATKAAPVTVRDLHLARGIGGKAFFTFTGLLADVEAAADAARAAAAHRLVGLEIIARPAGEIRGRLVF